MEGAALLLMVEEEAGSSAVILTKPSNQIWSLRRIKRDRCIKLHLIVSNATAIQ